MLCRGINQKVVPVSVSGDLLIIGFVRGGMIECVLCGTLREKRFSDSMRRLFEMPKAESQQNKQQPKAAAPATASKSQTTAPARKQEPVAISKKEWGVLPQVKLVFVLGLLCSLLGAGYSLWPKATDQTEIQLRNSNMKMLMDWFSQNGGKIHQNLTLKERPDIPGCWGFYAKGEIKPGDVLLDLPNQLIVTSFTAADSLLSSLDRLHRLSNMPAKELNGAKVISVLGLGDKALTGEELKSVVMNATWTTQTALTALYLYAQEGNEQHFFYPYIATLPSGCTSSLCWSRRKLERHFKQEWIAEMLASADVYKKIARKLGIPEERFLEFVSLVGSRAWGISKNKMVKEESEKGEEEEDDNDDIVGMQPIGDMFNHNPMSNTMANFGQYSEGVKTIFVESEAEKGYNDGDEVYITYGDKDNVALLENYNFILNDNPEDDCSYLEKYLLPRVVNSIHMVNGEGCPASLHVASKMRLTYLIMALVALQSVSMAVYYKLAPYDEYYQITALAMALYMGSMGFCQKASLPSAPYQLIRSMFNKLTLILTIQVVYQVKFHSIFDFARLSLVDFARIVIALILPGRALLKCGCLSSLVLFESFCCTFR
eukprot:g26518.t1